MSLGVGKTIKFYFFFQFSLLLLNLANFCQPYNVVINCVLTCALFQLTEVNMELTLRYHAEYYWTGFPPTDFQSNEEVCLQHFTSNPARVKVLLECRKLLITEISNMKNVEFSRPEVSQVHCAFLLIACIF